MGTCISYSNMSIDELLNEAQNEGGELIDALAEALESAERKLHINEMEDKQAYIDLEESLDESQSDLADSESEVIELQNKLKAIAELAEV